MREEAAKSLFELHAIRALNRLTILNFERTAMDFEKATQVPLKLELGGGTNPREGYLNVDCPAIGSPCDRVDIMFNLENLGESSEEVWRGAPDDCIDEDGLCCLPLKPESVSHVYTAHCLEHVQNLYGVLWELARVCQNGATIEIRVPHHLHPDAMCPAHKHVISENVVKGWCKRDWGGKRFDLVQATPMVNPPVYEQAREAFPQLKHEQILAWVPGAAFEMQFVLRVRRGS